MPRATSAACDALPPSLVRMPLRGVEARDVVGLGERPHEDHVAARRPPRPTASAAVKTISPLAAPGDAATPRASTS